MTKFLLDTNIVSNLSRPRPADRLHEWLGEQADRDLYIASITVAEIRRGILEKPAGRKRDLLQDWFVGPAGVKALFFDRILPFDEAAAWEWARLMAEGKRKGRPRDGLDMIIAATTLSRDCVLVTDNERDFAGLDIINPLRDR